MPWIAHDPTSPQPSEISTYQPTQIQPPIGNSANFQWKRCVDVAILEGIPAVSPDLVLFALFAASSDSNESNVGPTELRAYRVAGNTVRRAEGFSRLKPTMTTSNNASGTAWISIS